MDGLHTYIKTLDTSIYHIWTGFTDAKFLGCVCALRVSHLLSAPAPPLPVRPHIIPWQWRSLSVFTRRPLVLPFGSRSYNKGVLNYPTNGTFGLAYQSNSSHSCSAFGIGTSCREYFQVLRQSTRGSRLSHSFSVSTPPHARVYVTSLLRLIPSQDRRGLASGVRATTADSGTGTRMWRTST